MPSTPEENAPLAPRMKGRFNVYDTPDGGLHIAYQQDDSEEIKHIEMPGALVRMMDMVKSGEMTPVKALKAIAGMNRMMDSESAK